MIVGLDPGRRRVGVAVADLETRFARPLEVIDKDATDAVARVAQLVEEVQATRVVVGRPVGLSGEPGQAVAEQRAFVEALRSALPVEVEEYDERLTTVVAERSLASAGVPSRRRRTMRDAVAAQVMLQGYMDSVR
ncbi:MAG TPA: Holliday junction resolvase RuvX [Actinomycetota bacterium]|nr:Holliday junction resolvase RuvX [Actinomycetota bacterium]